MTDLPEPLPAPSRRDRLLALLPVPPGPALVAAALVGGLALVAVVLLLLRPGPAPPELVLPRAEPQGEAAPAPSTQGATVTVHAAGAVAHPGLYVVPAGARVADVVTAAGGASAEADLDQVNLAARVADADRVRIPRRGEPPVEDAPVPGGSGPGTAQGPLDLNRATAEQLDSLPGVGPATAAAILAYRQQHGRFRSVSELLEVRGIGPAKLDALRPLVKV